MLLFVLLTIAKAEYEGDGCTGLNKKWWFYEGIYAIGYPDYPYGESFNFPAGTSVTLACHFVGYALIGDNPVQCISGETYDFDEEPHCVEGDCIDLAAPSGEMNRLECSQDLTSCTFSCPAEYYTKNASGNIVTKNEVVCDPASSQWSHMTMENPLGTFSPCVAETASTFVIFVSSDYVSSEGVDNVDCITVAEQSTVLTDALYGVVQGKYDIPLCASQRQSQCMSVLDISCGWNSKAIDKIYVISSMIRFEGNTFDENGLQEIASVILESLNQGLKLFYPDVGIIKSDENHKSTVQKHCPYGSTYEIGICVPCFPGEYYKYETDTDIKGGCSPCPMSSYSDEAGSLTCIDCEDGETTLHSGSTSCISKSDVCQVPSLGSGNRSPIEGSMIQGNDDVRSFCLEGTQPAWTKNWTHEEIYFDDHSMCKELESSKCHKMCNITWVDREVYDDGGEMISEEERDEIIGAEVPYLFSATFYCKYNSGEYSALIVECGAPGDDIFVTCKKYIVYCSPEKEVDTVYGTYYWNEAAAGTIVQLSCSFNGQKNALKYCSEEGVFGYTDFSECSSQVTEDIINILEEAENIDAANQDKVSGNIASVTSTSGSVMSSTDISNTAEIIDSLLELESDMTLTTLENIIAAADNVQTNTETRQMADEEVCKSIRESSLGIASHLAKTRSGTVLITKQSIGYGVARVTEDRVSTLSLSGELNVIEGSKELELNADPFFTAEVKTKENTIATVVYYQNDNSFPSASIAAGVNIKATSATIAQKIENDMAKRTSDSSKLTEVVATVISDINIMETTFESTNNNRFRLDAGEQIIMGFKVQNELLTMVHSQTKRKLSVYNQIDCKFYDEKSRDWKTSGCTTVRTLNEETATHHVECSCDHLTSFAVLMSFSSESNTGEELVTEVLLGCSLICLLLTVLALVPYKKLRKMRSVKVNLMLAISLILGLITFFLMDFFVAADSTSTPSIPCLLIACLLNYFWLCQLSWMVIEAITMYLALVKVFKTYIQHAMLKYSLLGWALPLLFPILGVICGGSQFADPKTCFVRLPYGYATFYGPIVLGVLANWVLFVFIARVITRASREKAKRFNYLKSRSLRRQLQSALAISSLLGLSWVFGFMLLMNPANYSQIIAVLRWLFILCNAPQGVFIFLFYVVLRADVRKYWLNKFGFSKKTENIVTSNFNTPQMRNVDIHMLPLSSPDTKISCLDTSCEAKELTLITNRNVEKSGNDAHQIQTDLTSTVDSEHVYELEDTNINAQKEQNSNCSQDSTDSSSKLSDICIENNINMSNNKENSDTVSSSNLNEIQPFPRSNSTSEYMLDLEIQGDAAPIVSEKNERNSDRGSEEKSLNYHIPNSVAGMLRFNTIVQAISSFGRLIKPKRSEITTIVNASSKFKNHRPIAPENEDSDHYSGLRLNAHGNYVEVTVHKEKDVAIESTMRSRRIDSEPEPYIS